MPPNRKFECGEARRRAAPAGADQHHVKSGALEPRNVEGRNHWTRVSLRRSSRARRFGSRMDNQIFKFHARVATTAWAQFDTKPSEGIPSACTPVLELLDQVLLVAPIVGLEGHLRRGEPVGAYVGDVEQITGLIEQVLLPAIIGREQSAGRVLRSSRGTSRARCSSHTTASRTLI
ncbi:MAG: hypothetical protein H6Q33_313 [Deltaproteobacteria bacterium]|nr:hypothetical protein [Deltaproteobacteria bacterium]